MKQGLVFWFTGLSGSGKTTVATAVKELLEAAGYAVLVLDGDDVRKRLHVHLGFSEADIKKNNQLIAGLCQEALRHYDVIMVPIISPYRVSRAEARLLLGKRFYEIFFAADLETVMQRDVKGLYKLARENKIRNLIGYSPSNVYEPPEAPDLIIDSRMETIEGSTDKLHGFILTQLKNAETGEAGSRANMAMMLSRR
ncbi:MAG TPA: adenylyl-sulfate kinase [Syntrophales bacterium]|nr:adenylyl-sulfate kinase [Syntrophales bacterium]HQJ30759.1 adenylyl-sulfate kinase [Syntrophales bacterium]